MKKILSVSLILLVATAFTAGLVTDTIGDGLLNDVIQILYAASLILMIISLISREDGFGTTFFICSLIIPFTDVIYLVSTGLSFNDLMENSDFFHYNLAFGGYGWKEYVVVSIIVPLVLALIMKIVIPSKPTKNATSAREAGFETIS